VQRTSKVAGLMAKDFNNFYFLDGWVKEIVAEFLHEFLGIEILLVLDQEPDV
jgi:hypothetical protein